MTLRNPGTVEVICRQLLSVLYRQHASLTAQGSVPRITVPHNLIKNLEKTRVKNTVQKARQNYKAKYTSPLVISCKRSTFNHHKGQTYSYFNPKYLASYAWKHRKSAGDYFTILPHDSNPSLGGKTEGFNELGLTEELTQSLHRLGITKPTYIQELTIPRILKGQCVLSAAETGSGKTIAYLGPLIELIERKKSYLKGDNSSKNCPYAIILAPSKELADQIFSVAEQLCVSTSVKPHSSLRGSGTNSNWPERTEMDLIVATPGNLKKLIGRGKVNGHQLSHLVLDEMDTLLDDSFSEDIKSIITQLKLTAGQESGDSVFVNTDTQFILVGATIPRSLQEILQDVLPIEVVQRVTTGHVHQVMPHVTQKFIRIKPSSKPEAMLKLCKESQSKGLPTLVFCTKTSTCSWLSRFLVSSGVENVFFSGSLPLKIRSGLFQGFQSGESDILVCTDIASRGLDTSRVHRVINYEFPDFISDYIHRAGRTGRIGSQHPGQVINFISHKWEVDLVNKIEVSVRRMTELHNVNANIKRKLSGLSEEGV